MENYHFLKLNYCTKGRCEVSIENDKYVYIEEGILSLDSNPPKDEFVYPQGRYEGLEIIFDLEVLKEQPLTAFLTFGIDILKINEELKREGGSCLATVSKEWHTVADHLTELIKESNGTMEDYRFGVLHLMYLLGNGHARPLEKKYYLTKGQKKIAMEVEARISGNSAQFLGSMQEKREISTQ